MQLHIPSTLAIDVQAVYPLFLIPKILHGLPEWYITFSGDPLVKGAFHGGPDFNWFRSFFFLEACVGTGSFPIVLGETDSLRVSRCFQLPTFFILTRALWIGPPKLLSYYPLMLAYSASSCTTTFGCLAVLWSSPGLTQFQISFLLGTYLPFFFVPFGMAIDMTLRLTKSQGVKTLKAE